MTKKTLLPITLRDTSTIPAGTVCDLTLTERGIVAKFAGREVKLGYRNAHKNFGAPFTKVPTLNTLEKWGNDGIAKSITGARVECDGHGPDGAPSWMIALGVI